VAFSFFIPLVMRASFTGIVLSALLGFAALLACAIDAARLTVSRPPWKILVTTWAILFVSGWMLGDVLRTHVRRYVQAFTIPSRSMEPTLLWGDYVMADNAVYRGRSPRRGDVVVFKYPPDERRTFVGRIVGVPGETIHVRGQDVVVNGRGLDEPYVMRGAASEDACTYPYGCEPTPVPAGRYFIMGDNRDNARDSRYYGFVRAEALIGRIFTVYFSWDSEAHGARFGRVGKSM